MIIYLIYIRAVRGVGQILDENSTKFGKIVITRKVLLVFIWYFTYQVLWYGFIYLILFIPYFWRCTVLAKTNISKWLYNIKI